MASKVLHFFPGPKVLLWRVDGKVELRAEAWGGADPDPANPDPTMEPQRTTPGRYVVHSYAPYRTNTWSLSKLRWGTPLKVVSGDVYYATGKSGAGAWRKLSDLMPGMTPARLQKAHRILFGKDVVPDTWVFNDFGPKAVRYFRDKNHNKKLDSDEGEALSGEMIHTTPDNEGQVVKGEAVTLAPSHGCVHVNPVERDKFHAAGAFKRGTDFIIHKYTEDVPTAWH